MTIKKKIIGKGFSRKAQYELSGAESEQDKEHLGELRESWANIDLTLSERMKNYAVKLNGGKPVPAGTKKLDDPTISEEEWYAREINSMADAPLIWLKLLNIEHKLKLSEDDIQGLINFAYLGGKMVREAELKFKHEANALWAEKQKSLLIERRDAYNLKISQESKQVKQILQEQANSIWGRHPNWSARSVAYELEKQGYGNYNTIRRKIKKLS